MMWPIIGLCANVITLLCLISILFSSASWNKSMSNRIFFLEKDMFRTHTEGKTAVRKRENKIRFLASLISKKLIDKKYIMELCEANNLNDIKDLLENDMYCDEDLAHGAIHSFKFGSLSTYHFLIDKIKIFHDREINFRGSFDTYWGAQQEKIDTEIKEFLKQKRGNENDK